MSPTQRELEEAVLEAAEAWEETQGSLPMPRAGRLAEAVSALRESKRPHKAAVLNATIINEETAYLVTARENRSGRSTAMDWWGRATDLRKTQIRELLKLIAAAPDEPTEDKR